VAELEPVYLVHGDDDAKIDAWRARVRARAEAERGPGGLEALDAREATPDELAMAVATLTFDTGTRYVLVDHVEAWKAAHLAPLQSALDHVPPDTVLVLIVRGRPLKQLLKAVEEAGGELREEAAPKPWQLPKWTLERAREQGVELDQEAAKALATLTGGAQQRIARELEKLALAVHPRARVTLEDVRALAAPDSAPQAYELADALVAGDLPAALRLAEELKAHDERPGRLVFPIVRRLREVHRAARLLEAGVPEQKVGQALKAPPWLAKRTVAKARKADRAGLERALCAFADLEVALRGGPLTGATGRLDEDTAFSLALARAAS
jgi:DNA polymerase-3 subunit delta